MAKKALLIGINEYKEPSVPDLKGCVTDVRNFTEVLTAYFAFDPRDIRLLTNESATREHVFRRLEWLLAGSGPGDLLVFHFSGHGSQTVDRNGDELDDHKDEILCLHDMHHRNPSSYIVDDELNEVLKLKHPDAVLIVVLDACHSGTATRGFSADFGARSNVESVDESRARFIAPPEEFIHRIRAQENHDRSGQRRRTIFSRENGGIDHILLAACRDYQQAGERLIEEAYQGAFTHYMCKTIRRAEGSLTYRELMERVGNSLRFNNFTQSPHLGLPKSLKDERIFYVDEKDAESRGPVAPSTPDLPVVSLKRGRKKTTMQLHHAREQPGGEPSLENGRSFQPFAEDALRMATAETRKWLEQLRDEDMEVIGWFIEEPDDVKEAADNSSRSTMDVFPVSKVELSDIRGDEEDRYLLMEERDGLFILHAFEGEAGRVVSLPKRSFIARWWERIRGALHYLVKLPGRIVRQLTRLGLIEVEKALFDRGLYYYPPGADDVFAEYNQIPAENLAADAADVFDQPRRIVLFIHGFISSVDGSFKDLAAPPKYKSSSTSHNPELSRLGGVRTLQEQGWVVMGLNYLSVSLSPTENAEELAEKLRHIKNLEQHEFTIIAFSRGALTARAFLTYVNKKEDGDPLIRVTRLLTFGSPNSGTNLAKRIFNLVNVLANLSRFMNLNMPLKILVAILKYVVNEDVPLGAAAMLPDGEFINELEEKEKEGKIYEHILCGYAASNFEPKNEAGFWRKLADFFADEAIFPGHNDVIVDTARMDLPKHCEVQSSDIIKYEARDGSDHFQYFNKETTHAFVMDMLKKQKH